MLNSTLFHCNHISLIYIQCSLLSQMLSESLKGLTKKMIWAIPLVTFSEFHIRCHHWTMPVLFVTTCDVPHDVWFERIFSSSFRYQPPALAISSLYWKAWLLLLVVNAFNPQNIGEFLSDLQILIFTKYIFTKSLCPMWFSNCKWSKLQKPLY